MILKSTESLHRRAKLFRLIHRRRLHLLSYAFKLSKNVDYLDQRHIHTRHHEAKLFMLKNVIIINVRRILSSVLCQNGIT